MISNQPISTFCMDREAMKRPARIDTTTLLAWLSAAGKPVRFIFRMDFIHSEVLNIPVYLTQETVNLYGD